MSPTSQTDGREPETVPPVGLFNRSSKLYRGLNRRRRWQTLCALTVVLALAAVIAWAVQRPARHSNLAGEYAAPTQGEISAVMQLLQRRGEELLDRDAKGWSADLDGVAASSKYTEHERAVFADLAGVPLRTWRYTLTAPVTDPGVLAPAANRLGGRVVILHVRLQYALALVDPEPTSKDLWLTAVQRPGGWRLASDSDAAGAGGTSWQGPWDYGKLLVRTGPHTLVLVHPDEESLAAAFAGLVERSVPIVSSVWGTDWNEHVAVLIPDSPEEFASISGDSLDSHDIAAVAVADSVSPDGTVLGARIVLNPATLPRLDAAGRRLVVQHELTHIATRAATDDRMPTWVIEGFADYIGNLDSEQPVRSAAAELSGEIRHGMVPAALPTSADFDGANTRLAQVYEESWLACRLIAARAGQQGLVSFYKDVSAAALSQPATAAAAGLRQTLHTDVASFTAQWRAYLEAELR